MIVCLTICLGSLSVADAVNAQDPSCPQFVNELGAASDNLCDTLSIETGSSEMARGEADSLIVSASSTNREISAGDLALIIEKFEALSLDKVFAIDFQDIDIVGPLRLIDITTRARLTFTDVRFLPDNPTKSGRGRLPAIEILRSRFDERVTFRRTAIIGDVHLTSSGFLRTVDFQESDIGGKLVIDDALFRSDLDLSDGNTIRDQLILDNVTIDGDADLDHITFADTPLIVREPFLRNTDLPLTELAKVGCKCRNVGGGWRTSTASMNRTLQALEPQPTEKDASAILEQSEQLCGTWREFQLCPRSGGSDPQLIELNNVTIGGSLRIVEIGMMRRQSDDFQVPVPRYLSCRRDNASGILRDCKTLSNPICFVNSVGCADSSSLAGIGVANMTLHGVEVRGATLIKANQFATLRLTHNTFERFDLDDNAIGIFVLEKNDIAYLLVRNGKFENVFVVDGNSFRGSVDLESPMFGELFLFTITNNRIAQNLYFEPFDIERQERTALDISSNTIGARMHFVLPIRSRSSSMEPVEAPSETEGTNVAPLAWYGDLDLTGLNVGGTLRINLGVQDWGRKRVIQWPDPLTFRQLHQSDLSFVRRLLELYDYIHAGQDPYDGDNSEKRCHPDDAIDINLSNAVVNDLVWELPIRTGCFHWQGVGLHYASWGTPDLSIDEKSELMDLWTDYYRKTSSEGGAQGIGSSQRVPPDPLHHMADFFLDFGAQSRSREIRAEAKSADFPRPEEPFLDQPISFAGWIVARVLLWPTNFGTQPERAIIILMISIVGTLVILWIYSLSWGKAWKNAIIYRREWQRQQQDNAEIENLEIAALMKRFDRTEDVLRALEEKRAVIKEINNKRHPFAENVELLNSKKLDEDEILHVSSVGGFLQYDRNRQPQHFNLFRFALDSAIPVIDLHAYSQYYPVTYWARWWVMAQQIFGWYIVTSFLATIAVL